MKQALFEKAELGTNDNCCDNLTPKNSCLFHGIKVNVKNISVQSGREKHSVSILKNTFKQIISEDLRESEDGQIRVEDIIVEIMNAKWLNKNITGDVL